MEAARKLRVKLNAGELVVAPGAYNALTARLIEQTGFPAVYMTGYGVAAERLAMPDIGVVTMTEMVDQARYIARAVDIPVIADADAGYGGIDNVVRTVREYEKASIAAIHLEDQILPKRFGVIDQVDVMSQEETIARIRAAVAARQDPDFLIIGRTDSLDPLGLEEAIARGQAMAEAGADVIFVHSLFALDDIIAVRKAIDKPLLFNMVDSFVENIDVAVLREIGYNIAIFPTSCLWASTSLKLDLLRTLKIQGSTKAFWDRMVKPFEFLRLLERPTETVGDGDILRKTTTEQVSNYKALGGTLKFLTNRLRLQHMELVIGIFQPGESLKPHYHRYPTEECYYIYYGTGITQVGGRRLEVAAGSSVSIPSGIVHYPLNTGDEEMEICFVLAPSEEKPPIVAVHSHHPAPSNRVGREIDLGKNGEANGALVTLSEPLRLTNMSVIVDRLKPGESRPLYSHPASLEEALYVCQGQGLLSVGDESLEIRKGTALSICPGVPRHLTNTEGRLLEVILASVPGSHRDK